MPRKPEYKPLLYTTTIRNPERFKDFMHILKRFNGRILNNKTVELFERELFKVGLYRPMKARKQFRISGNQQRTGN